MNRLKLLRKQLNRTKHEKKLLNQIKTEEIENNRTRVQEKEDEPNKRNYTCFRVHMDMEMEELNGEERKLM